MQSSVTTPAQRWKARNRQRVSTYNADYAVRPGVHERRMEKQRLNPNRAAVYRRWETKKGPLGMLLHRAMRNARATGREFTITGTDLTPLPTHCPVLGIELDYTGTPGRNPRAKEKYARASVDRKDSRKGYVPGNVVVVSFRANCLKSDATADELRKLASFYCRD